MDVGHLDAYKNPQATIAFRIILIGVEAAVLGLGSGFAAGFQGYCVLLTLARLGAVDAIARSEPSTPAWSPSSSSARLPSPRPFGPSKGANGLASCAASIVAQFKAQQIIMNLAKTQNRRTITDDALDRFTEVCTSTFLEASDYARRRGRCI